MTSTPDPVIGAALTRAGLDPNDRAARDTATPTTCQRCGAPTLTGLDDTTAALRVTVDPWPITIRDEATAWLSTPPRPTHQLHPNGRGGLRIRARDHWQITGSPPAPGRHIVAEHRCGQPLGNTTPPTAQPPAHHTTGVPY